MWKANEFLSVRERRFLSRLGLVCSMTILLLLLSFLFWTQRLTSLRAESVRLKTELGKISAQTEQARLELERWKETVKDLEDMRMNAFYSSSDSLEAFRQDLKQLFQQTGLPLPAVSYQYDEPGKKELRRLAASFSLRFTYPMLKRFFYQLETWPRLLVLDQINFQKIDNLSGTLDLRITLAGFYHEAE